MYFGLFNIYGYDLSFYKKISRDKKLIYNIAEIRTELNRRFIDYLKETIEKYVIIFISGLRKYHHLQNKLLCHIFLISTP